MALLISWSAFPGCSVLEGRRPEKVAIQVGDVRLTAEVASTPEERERGLMYRRSIGEDEGMLFVFPRAVNQSFWMKNTLIPLDVGFFDDQGFLIEYRTMLPDDGKKIYTSSEPALYALEVKSGWFERHNLRKYARLHLPRELHGL